jgi:uncharacterized protein
MPLIMRALVGTLLRTAPLIHRTSSPGGILKRAKYCLRGLAYAPITKEWFEFLQTPELSFIVENHPALFQKLQRPYLNRTLGTTARLEALKQHYQFVLTHFSGSLINEVYGPGGKLLAEIAAKNVGTIEMRLCCNRMQKEGDLTIGLSIKESEKAVASISFSIWKCDGDFKEIFVGGLQGDKAVVQDDVVDITCGLYGLRPKALLVYLLQQLAEQWEITRVRAVSDDMHIYRHFQSHRNVNACYDKFWIECGGMPVGEGIFDLPVAFVPREISTVRVNKRQLYKRRYAMLEEIAEQIRASFANANGSFAKTAAESVSVNLAAPQVANYARAQAA